MKAALIILSILSLAGCASYAELGDGMYAKTVASQDPYLFGTNTGHARLDICRGDKAHWWQSVRLYDCRTEVEWQLVSSQGQGGQIVAGALNVVGAGVIASQIGQGASATANAVSQSVSSAGRHGHHR